MSTDSTSIVRGVLQSYADRGIFRGFRELDPRPGKAEFEILCFPITQIPFHLVYDDKTETLVFKSLLSGMPARSEMYRELKAFVKQRSAADLPEHRRVDPRRVELKCSNRQGNVSVTLGVKNHEYEYATRKAINLLTDIFSDLLTESPYYEFMDANFEMPED